MGSKEACSTSQKKGTGLELCGLRGAATRSPAPHPPTAHGARRRPGCEHRPEAASTALHGAAGPGFRGKALAGGAGAGAGAEPCPVRG